MAGRGREKVITDCAGAAKVDFGARSGELVFGAAAIRLPEGAPLYQVASPLRESDRTHIIYYLSWIDLNEKRLWTIYICRIIKEGAKFENFRKV